ncbi:TPR-like protein [Hanseniaspora valbyensis NRRL Y-1626]|uniref:TPR-like protein n=1 Tax=Hanseniaspora valbyensis NRRL Y-1626 TaxID=766949 RepID=A0A1B7THR0_9ASCO|nr:TPR-like protein [Hanseniaspora valbyensis NRRL Y-1626]
MSGNNLKKTKKNSSGSKKSNLSSGDLLTIKNYLKNAKDDFTKKNFEDCIEWCDYILEIDNSNFFAILLKGKCFNTLEKYKKAIEMYELNVSLDEDNILGYKGEWEVFNNFFTSNFDNKDILERFEELICPFDKFFDFLHIFYIKNMEINDTLTANNIIILLTDFKIKVPESESYLLKKCIPNNDTSSFANVIGPRIYSKKDSLTKALQFELKQEKMKKLKVKALNRMNNNNEDIRNAQYEIYKESPIEIIYQEIINCLLEEEDSNDERFKLEEELLNYRLEKVKYFPDNIKFDYFAKNILENLENLMLIGKEQITSKLYRLYLDWMDFNSLEDGIQDIQQNIKSYMLKFPEDNLSQLFLAVICSKHSIFKFDDKELELIKSKFDEDILITEEDQCFGMIVDCIEKLQSTSLIAIRLAVNYLVLTKKYNEALPIIEKGINICRSFYQDYAFNMTNTKLSFSLDLALVYTYVDAPKYHVLALKLYDQYISEDPRNLRAKLGKAVVFAEREEFEDASELISEYLKVYPNSVTALEKFSYCQLQLGNYETSLQCLEKILINPELGSQLECDVRFQQSVIFLKKFEQENDDDENDYLNMAYESLIKAIKIDEFYFKAFQQLGFLYSEYFEDEARAFKCYWKAFFLNNGDMKSAHYIVTKLCEEQEWKMASSICKDLIDSNLVKRQLQFENWPYRVLGIYNLDIGELDQSIDWLQNSIRVNNYDQQSLVALGQAYLESGKAEAALKVFSRVIELYPDYEYGMFFYAIILSKLGSFVDAEEIFNNLCFEDEKIEFKDCYLIEYITHLAEYAVYLNGQGFISKSCNKATKLIECVQLCVQDLNCSNYNSIWTSLNIGLKIFLATGSKHDDLPIETLVDIFESAKLLEQEIDILKDHPITLVDLAAEDDHENGSGDDCSDTISIISKCLILSSKCSFVTSNYEKHTRAIKASLWYNLATSELTSFVATSNSIYRDASILAYKQSIKLQSNIADSWNGLGMATMDINYKVSQHCFIKALSISPKEPLIYNNLAILALKYKDTHFANTLFQKSQSLFPINYFSWFGLALSNEINGDEDLAAKYFKHSFLLSNNKNDFVAVYYAMAILKENFVFKKYTEGNNTIKLQEFIFTIRSLEVYLKKKPHDSIAIESILLLLERVEDFASALPFVEKLLATYETKLDDDSMENNLVLIICRLKAQYARILLSQGEFDKSIEEAQSSNEIGGFVEGTSEEVKISNDVVIGLASHFKGNNKEALEILTKYKVDSVMEIAYKIMFTSGTNIKFDAWNNSKLLKIYTAISLVNKDKQNYKELITKLNKTLKTDDPDLLDLLTVINKRLDKDNTHLLQRSLFINPDNLNTWEIVDPKLAFRLMDSKPLQVATPELKSDILIKTQQLSKIQRAMFLTPWKVEAVDAFTQCYL